MHSADCEGIRIRLFVFGSEEARKMFFLVRKTLSREKSVIVGESLNSTFLSFLVLQNYQANRKIIDHEIVYMINFT